MIQYLRSLRKQQTDKGSSLRGFFAYDVYFADGDGNRVEPNGRVRVTVEYKTPVEPEFTDAAMHQRNGREASL